MAHSLINHCCRSVPREECIGNNSQIAHLVCSSFFREKRAARGRQRKTVNLCDKMTKLFSSLSSSCSSFYLLIFLCMFLLLLLPFFFSSSFLSVSVYTSHRYSYDIIKQIKTKNEYLWRWFCCSVVAFFFFFPFQIVIYNSYHLCLILKPIGMFFFGLRKVYGWKIAMSRCVFYFFFLTLHPNERVLYILCSIWWRAHGRYT